MKGKLGRSLNKIKSFLFHKQKTKQVLTTFGILVGAFLLLIPSGVLNNSTPIYDSAFYFSELIKRNNVDFIPVIAEQIDEEHKMNSTPLEYRGLYEAFETKQVNFVGTVNADKSDEIFISDIENCPNLSFIYASVGFQNRKFEDHYLHESYNLELMFYGKAARSGDDYSFVYISESQAKYLLINIKGIPEEDITIDDYESLISTSINLSIKGVIYSYTIGNVYLQQNFFYESIQNSIGDFLLGYDFYPEGLQKQATFFMNSHEFQNKTYLNYSLQQYSPSHYKYKLAKQNLDFEINDTKALKFSTINEIKNSFSIVFVILSIGLLGFGCYWIIRNKLFMQKANYIYFSFSGIIVYLFMFVTFALSKNIYIFSPFAGQMLIFELMVFIIFCIVFYYISKWKRGSV